jgi:capsular exopolysaccharide synthesis family protein
MESFVKSRESIESNFSDYLLALKRRWKPAVSIFTATVILSILAASLLRQSYQVEGRLLFKNSTFKVLGDSLLPNNIEGGDFGDLRPLVSNQNPLVTQIQVISSPSLLLQTIEKLKLKNDRGQTLKVTDFKDALNLKIIGGADILQVGYKHHDPVLAVKVVNTLMNLYVENDKLTNRTEAEAISQFMSEQLPKTQLAVSEAEIALRKFKQQNNTIDLAEEAKTAVSTIGNLEANITTVRSQLEELKAQRSKLQQKINLNDRDAMAFSATSQSPEIQGTLAQIQDTDRQLATERSRFSDNNPIVLNLQEKKVKLTTLLKQQASGTTDSRSAIPEGSLRVGELKQNLIKDLLQSEVQQNGANEKLVSLQQALALYKKRVSTMPQLVQTQHQLERQLEVSQSTYQILLKKFQAIQLAKSNNISNARIIDRAIVPDRPERSMKNVVVGLGVLLGALFATSAVAYLEMSDRFVESGKDISKLFRNRLLGSLPSPERDYAFDGSPELTNLEVAVRDIRKSLSTDNSQIIQFNVRLVGSEKLLKIITITSTVANEEKSKKAANLAVAIAGLGQKVLLIDADLRNPYQHYFWKLPLQKGLSELLAGKCEFQQVLWRVMDNLDIITAGAGLANPTFNFESQQMRSLVQEVSHLYDFAIVDTPPLLVSANAMNMGQINNGILTIDLQDDLDRSIET